MEVKAWAVQSENAKIPKDLGAPITTKGEHVYRPFASSYFHE
jgi:hypothetical protein